MRLQTLYCQNFWWFCLCKILFQSSNIRYQTLKHYQTFLILKFFLIWPHISLCFPDTFSSLTKKRQDLDIIKIFHIPINFWDSGTQPCNFFIIFLANKILWTTFWATVLLEETLISQFQYGQILGILYPSHICGRKKFFEPFFSFSKNVRASHFIFMIFQIIKILKNPLIFMEL